MAHERDIKQAKQAFELDFIIKDDEVKQKAATAADNGEPKGKGIRAFKALISWLKSKGVTGCNRLSGESEHDLRASILRFKPTHSTYRTGKPWKFTLALGLGASPLVREAVAALAATGGNAEVLVRRPLLEGGPLVQELAAAHGISTKGWGKKGEDGQKGWHGGKGKGDWATAPQGWDFDYYGKASAKGKDWGKDWGKGKSSKGAWGKGGKDKDWKGKAQADWSGDWSGLDAWGGWNAGAFGPYPGAGWPQGPAPPAGEVAGEVGKAPAAKGPAGVSPSPVRHRISSSPARAGGSASSGLQGRSGMPAPASPPATAAAPGAPAAATAAATTGAPAAATAADELPDFDEQTDLEMAAADERARVAVETAAARDRSDTVASYTGATVEPELKRSRSAEPVRSPALPATKA